MTELRPTDGRSRTNTLDWASLALVIVGAANWGLVGLAGLYELSVAYQLYSARTGLVDEHKAVQ